MSEWRVHNPYRSPYDPCPPRSKKYMVPVNQMYTFQPEDMRQFTAREALRHGTLWPDLYSPYKRGGRGE